MLWVSTFQRKADFLTYFICQRAFSFKETKVDQKDESIKRLRTENERYQPGILSEAKTSFIWKDSGKTHRHDMIHQIIYHTQGYRFLKTVPADI